LRTRRSIAGVHAHAVLMLAATAVVALFVGIVVVVTQLQRRGRLGDPARRVPFHDYGPVLAAACSGGAAAVHLGVVGEHAARATSAGSADAYALLCSIGAGAAHFSGSDVALAGFLPLGVLSLGTIGAQGVLALPRLWQGRRSMFVGVAVTIGALAVALLSRALAPAPAPAAGIVGVVGIVPAGSGAVAGVQPMAYSDWLAIVLDAALLLVVALLALGRPRRLLDRLRVSVTDAWVGTGLGVGAVGVFTVAGYALAFAPH
jgi:hypothetical protein